MSGYLIEKKTILQDVEEISISEEKILVRGTDKIIKEVDKSSFGGDSVISVTKFELDNLIYYEELIPGKTYKITGVDYNLYTNSEFEGTTIYLQALSTKKLSPSGYGEFWNPKYDNFSAGLGVYTNKSTYSFAKRYDNKKDFFTESPAEPGNQSLFDPYGNYYFYNPNSGEIIKVDDSGSSTVFATIPVGTQLISSMCIDSNNVIYCSVFTSENKIYKVGTDGTVTLFATTPGGSILSMICDTANNLYASKSVTNTLIKITPAGEVSTFASLGTYPLSMVIDNANILYIACKESNEVSIVDTTTSSVVNVSTYSDPTGMAINRYTTEVYINCTAGRVIQKLMNDTAVTIIEKQSASYGITIDENTNTLLYVDDAMTQYQLDNGRKYAFNDFTIEGNLFPIVSSEGKVMSNNGINIYKNTLKPYSTYSQGETIKAQNGDIGQFVANPEDTMMTKISGNWGNDIGIVVAQTSLEEFEIHNVTDIISYNINDTICHGGYVWRNVSGNIGQIYSPFELSPDWTKIEYYSSYYDFVIDYIEFDFNSGLITRRRDSITNNDVSQTPLSFRNSGKRSIAYFMWNKENDRISSNTVIDSICDTINFRGEQFRGNTLKNNSVFESNLFEYYGIFDDNELNESILYNNVLLGSIMTKNSLTRGQISHNILTSSSISENFITNYGSIIANYLNQGTISSNEILEGSGIQSNEIRQGASISDNTLARFNYITNNNLISYSNISVNKLDLGASINTNILSNNSYIEQNEIINNSGIDNNFVDNSTIRYNKISNNSGCRYNSIVRYSSITNEIIEMNSQFSSNKLNNTSFENNKISKSSNFCLTTNNFLIGRYIQLLEVVNSNLYDIDFAIIPSLLLLFESFAKTVYRRPDGTHKIRYYDNDDNLVINDITD